MTAKFPQISRWLVHEIVACKVHKIFKIQVNDLMLMTKFKKTAYKIGSNYSEAIVMRA